MRRATWPKQIRDFKLLPEAEQAQHFDAFACKLDKRLEALGRKNYSHDYMAILKAIDGDARFLDRIPQDQFHHMAHTILTDHAGKTVKNFIDSLHHNERLITSLDNPLKMAARMRFIGYASKDSYADLVTAVKHVPFLDSIIRELEPKLHILDDDKNFELVIPRDAIAHEWDVRLNFRSLISPVDGKRSLIGVGIGAGCLHKDSLKGLKSHWEKHDNPQRLSTLARVTDVFRGLARGEIYNDKETPEWVTKIAQRQLKSAKLAI
jgi:hypothetical protein